MNVLLVDESDADKRLIEHALTRANHTMQLTHTHCVEEVEESLATNSFDTILLSDQIPAWDAMALVLHIRNHTKDPRVAIIMLSESESDEHTLNCMRAGAHDVILKSEITEMRLLRSVALATARSELELKLRQSYDKVKFLADHDALTGVCNRHVFNMNLQTSVEQAQIQHTSVALLLVNIDRFKFINDTYGHHVGDQILVEFCDRLKLLLGTNEQFFRVGGDEFAVVLKDLRYAHIGGIHQRILRNLETPFAIDGIHIRLTLSAGVAFTPQNCDTAEHLLRCADIAMYRAKNMGYNHICFVDDDAHEQFQRRYQVEQELEHAIESREFVLHYQPVVSAINHQLLSCEALIRWQHPSKGLLYPDAFIDIAEETGQIVEVGKCIIDQACHQMAQWQKSAPVDIVMALNISPQQLYDKHLLEFFDRKLADYHLRPEQFEIEITETALLKNTAVLLGNLDGFVQRGFGLALDDFGTGFSSIQHLQSFPISTVKIDRSLMPRKVMPGKVLASPSTPDRTLSLLKGLVSMVHSMDLSIVAEGIEDDSNASLCRNLGVQRLQGYHFSRPVEADEFENRFLFAHLMEKLAV